MDNSENSEENKEQTEIRKELQAFPDQDDDGSGKVSNVIIKTGYHKNTFRPEKSTF